MKNNIQEDLSEFQVPLYEKAAQTPQPKRTKNPVSKITPTKEVQVPFKEKRAEVLPPQDFGDISQTERGVVEINLWVDYLQKKRLVPDSLKTPSSLLMAISACKALGFTDFGKMLGAIKNMYVFNGSLHMFGELPKSLVDASGLLESIDEFFVDKDGKRISYKNKNLNENPTAAVCLMKRKGGTENEFVVTKQDLINSGGIQKENGTWEFRQGKGVSYTWKAYPKNHWKLRVRRMAIKALFPDILCGISLGTGPDSVPPSDKKNEDPKMLETYLTEEERIGKIKKNQQPEMATTKEE